MEPREYRIMSYVPNPTRRNILHVRERNGAKRERPQSKRNVALVEKKRGESGIAGKETGGLYVSMFLTLRNFSSIFCTMC
jgi:hypothetical protein